MRAKNSGNGFSGGSAVAGGGGAGTITSVAGTANQVLVNGAATAVPAGAVVLSLANPLVVGTSATAGNIDDASVTTRFSWSSGGTNVCNNSGATVIQVVAGSFNTNFAGNITTITIGTTLAVKSGSNAKSGTFTLVGGAATVANTSVTANSVIVPWLKTVGGTILGGPYGATITPGTGFTVAGGGAANTSVYNYIILEVD